MARPWGSAIARFGQHGRVFAENGLSEELSGAPDTLVDFHTGAEHAGELDAKRAIDQCVRLASKIESAAPGSVYGMPVGWQAGALEWLQRNVVKR